METYAQNKVDIYIYIRARAHTHTHTHTHVYIHACIYLGDLCANKAL